MEKQDDLFDWKHLKLWRISSQAEFFSLIVLVIFILLGIAKIFQYNQFAQEQFQTDLLGLISLQPVYLLDGLLQMAKLLIQGIVYYLVLNGIALGLNMIVETDINYREKNNEGEIE